MQLLPVDLPTPPLLLTHPHLPLVVLLTQALAHPPTHRLLLLPVVTLPHSKVL